MAVIRPFRGIRYDRLRVQDLGAVVAQPYDRIGPELQDRYYAMHPANVVRLIKGRHGSSDGETDNVYTRARDAMGDWLQRGILVREHTPALYVLHQQFPLPTGETVTRKALICAFGLVPFEEGTVLPHERTLSGPKIDRLLLTRATNAYFGNIFMLYPDPENRVNAILQSAIDRSPEIDIRESYENDVRQMAWVVTDPGVVSAVAAEMAPKRNLIIADGHHRYETALNYQAEQQARFPNALSDAAHNYAMVALVSMSDPGLTILPTHRLIHSYHLRSSGEVMDRVRSYFTVDQLPDRSAMESQLHELRGQVGCLGAVTEDQFYLLRLTGGAVMERLAPGRVQSWCELDVSILHEVILEHVMGLTKESIERKENIEYLREPDDGYAQVLAGRAQFLFLLNATRMDQVIACTQAGEKMPQKSTDFYPKVITGLAFLPVGPEDRI